MSGQYIYFLSNKYHLPVLYSALEYYCTDKNCITDAHFVDKKYEYSAISQQFIWRGIAYFELTSPNTEFLPMWSHI